MIINFVALKRHEGAFRLERDELEEAKADGVDIEDRSAVAEYFRGKWDGSGIIEDIISDESEHSETEIIEWSAQ